MEVMLKRRGCTRGMPRTISGLTTSHLREFCSHLWERESMAMAFLVCHM